MATSRLVERIRRGIIGEGELMDGPFGPRRVTYADYTASGRSLDFIRDAVLPRYANAHTESSGTGLATTRLREDARRIIRDAVRGTADDLVIFCGSGAPAMPAAARIDRFGTVTHGQGDHPYLCGPRPGAPCLTRAATAICHR